MNIAILACGPYFGPGNTMLSLVLLLVLKPLAYYAYARAFRYRVSGDEPLTRRQAAGAAVIRALLGILFVGGGALVLTVGLGVNPIISWAYLMATRLAAWWIVGGIYLIRQRRLVAWCLWGMVINLGFDAALITGWMSLWFGTPGILIALGVLIAVIEARGRRPALVNRFDVFPHCTNCGYNLTGNVSGVCPECGKAIAGQAPSAAARLQ